MNRLRTALLDALRELERTQWVQLEDLLVVEGFLTEGESMRRVAEYLCVGCGATSTDQASHACARTRLHADIADAIRRSE